MCILNPIFNGTNMKSRFSVGKILIVFAFLFLIHSTQFAQTEKLSALDNYISNAVSSWEMPGFAVAIVRNDSVIFAKGYGVTDINTNEKVDENTLFVIASCSKAFTTASLATLVDRGLIGWDDKVIKYLPDFQMYDPWVTNEMNIKDLVTHRSGLATFSGDMLWLGSKYDRKEVIRRARFLKPVSSFRTKFGYQNIMYSTAGEIIEAVTDTTWEDYIKEHFFKPLGMTRSNTSISELVKMKNIAKPHQRYNGGIRVISYYPVNNVAPAAAINSSVLDMSHWIRLQLGRGKYEEKKIFSEAQSREMWSNQLAFGTSNYGLGWSINYYKGKRVLDHGGGMPGMISNVTLIPEINSGFVILSNMETGLTGAIKNKILDYFLGDDSRDWNTAFMDGWKQRLERYAAENKRREDIRVKDTSPTLPLDNYCGIYEDKMYGKAEVSMKEGKLFLQFLPSPTFRGQLNHYDYDVFYIDWEDEFLTRGYVKFSLDFNGKVKDMTFEVPNSPDFIFTELYFEKQK